LRVWSKYRQKTKSQFKRVALIYLFMVADICQS
jgi:hypothetical protein